MSSREEILQHLFGLHRRGRVKYDLERISEAAARFGNPQQAYPSVHVAGTNGKGSVCAMLESILRAAGVRTGLFIKPHLVAFEERFQIDGRPVAPRDWLDIYGEIEPVIADQDLTFFEISTLLAFELFRRAKVDWAVFETGMGGRLDATNVISPRVSVITSIGMDHTDWLGNDLVTIAGEKLGIVKNGVPLVLVEPADAGVRALAERTCRKRGATLEVVGERDVTDIELHADAVLFRYGKTAVRVPLAGRQQIVNALAALRAAELAGVDDRGALSRGLAATYIPARFQVLSLIGKVVVFDIAHNPAAAARLAASLHRRFGGAGICCVIGVMHDKDAAGILAHLCGVVSEFILTEPDIPRACPAALLASCLPHTSPVARRSIKPVCAAARAAMESETEVVCITGSFYTVGEAMQELGIEPYPKQLGCGL